MSREGLIELLDTTDAWAAHETPGSQTHPTAAEAPREPLTADADTFWRGTERFLEALEPVYTEASARGLNLFLGP